MWYSAWFSRCWKALLHMARDTMIPITIQPYPRDVLITRVPVIFSERSINGPKILHNAPRTVHVLTSSWCRPCLVRVSRISSPTVALMGQFLAARAAGAALEGGLEYCGRDPLYLIFRGRDSFAHIIAGSLLSSAPTPCLLYPPQLARRTRCGSSTLHCLELHISNRGSYAVFNAR